MKHLTILALLGFAPVFAQVPVTTCNTVIQQGTVISGDLDVPEGSTCTVYGEVQGNVTVEGYLALLGGSHLDNNLYVTGGRLMVNGWSWTQGAAAPFIGGDVTITNSTGGGSMSSNQSQGPAIIGGNLTFSGNSGAYTMFLVSVGKNAIFSNNNGAITLYSNQIGQNLNCSGNTPAPPTGSGNQAKHYNGQCSAGLN